MLLDDLRFALRSLTRRMLFSATAVLVAGVGLAVVVAFVNLANGVLFAPLPYPDDGRLVALSEERAGEFTAFSAVSPVGLDLLRREAATMDLGSFRFEQLPVRLGAEPELRSAARVDEELFAVLGTGPALGRGLGPGDAGRQVAVLSHGAWERLFGGDPDVLGRTVRVDGSPYTVIGVMPPRFNVPARGRVEFFLPSDAGTAGPEERRARSLSVVGRLDPDASRESAALELSALGPALRELTASDASFAIRPEPVERTAFFGDIIWLFLGAAGLLLLVTCSNVGGLLLARTSQRRSEAAVRAALGGSARRIFRQGMLESLLLATAASTVGVLGATWLTDLFRWVLPAELPWWSDTSVADPRVILFAVFATVVTVLLIGTAPSLEAARVDLRSSLVAGGSSTTSTTGAGRLRSLAVGIQLALAFVLVATSVMGWRGTQATERVDLGWPADEVLLLPLTIDAPATPGNGADAETAPTAFADARAAFFAPLEATLSTLPGVNGLAWSALPVGVAGTPLGDDATVGPAGSEGRPIWTVDRRAVSPDFFDVSGIALREGRAFEEGGGPAVVVNEALARAWWGSEPALGQRVVIDGIVLDVVGVAADVRSLRGGRQGMRATAEPMLYLPIEETSLSRATLRIRTPEPDRMSASVRAAASSVLPDRVLPEIRTAEEEEIGSTLMVASFLSTVFAFFAALALLFSAAGLYALISYSVSQRTREIGIRTALGAGRNRVLGGVVGHALRLSALALVAGGVLALGAGTLVRGLFLGTGAFDLATHAPAALLLLVVAALAAAIPARRALAVDPVRALRSE